MIVLPHKTRLELRSACVTADQDRNDRAAPQDEARIALGLRNTLVQGHARAVLQALDRGELLAEGVEVLLARTFGLDSDRILPRCGVCSGPNGQLTDIRLPRARGRDGVVEQARRLGIVVDQAAQANDRLVQRRPPRAIRLKARLASRYEVAAQSGLLIEHGGTKEIQAAYHADRVASGFGRLVQLAERETDRDAAEDRHDGDYDDRPAGRALEFGQIGRASCRERVCTIV